MQKHTQGFKSERIFCKKKETNEPFEVIAFSNNDVIIRNLVDEDHHVSIHNAVDWGNGFIEISQAEVFSCIDNSDDEQHARMMESLGIGYICPFCGGRLRWESDFMMSEVCLIGGENLAYIKITDENRISELAAQETQLRNSNCLSDTDNIESDNERIDADGYYSTMYKKESKDGAVSWYEINDAVVGIYTCQNCGKRYEVCDCLPSEQDEYPYFQK